MGWLFWRFLSIGVLFLVISLVIRFVLGLIPFGREISWFVTELFLAPLAITYDFFVYSNLKALKGEIAFAPTGGQKTKFVVVVVIGLLLTAIFFSTVFLNLSSTRKKARDARRESDIHQIQIGLEFYYNQYESYPSSLNELSPYLTTVPVDPKTNLPYQYQRRGETNYQVCAQLEAEKTQKCVTSLRF